MRTRDTRERIGSALGRLVPARLSRSNRPSRGAAELSVLLVATSLVTGVVFGQSLSRTVLDLADGLTWLTDDPSGEIIQVNPATGELQMRQQVGAPGDDLDIAQYDGRLFVTNHTTGQLMSFDLTSILISGQRRVATGGAVDTLVHDGSVFLVDEETSSIAAIDPVRTDTIGRIWVAPNGLVDASIDDTGTVWALEDDGTLNEMRWSDSTQEFEELDTHAVELSGPGSVLVAHDRGTTVFGPDQGIIAQQGTDDDLLADVPKLAGEALAPESSPAELVPSSAPETSTVIIGSRDGVLEVDVATIDCPTPGTPEIFRGLIYVPCTGSGKVIVLDASGARARDDILTPDSADPELVLDDDNLIINTPGADTGVVIRSDGSISSIVRKSPDVPVNDPATSDNPPPPPSVDDVVNEITPPPPSQPGPGPGGPDLGPGPEGPGGPRGPGGPGGSCEPPKRCPDGPGIQPPVDPPDDAGGGTGSEDDPLAAPVDVSARSLAGGQAEITWTHDTDPGAESFVVRSTDGSINESAGGSNRQALVPIETGRAYSFTVTARRDSESVTSAASNQVTSTDRPGAPSVTGTADYTGTTASTMVFTVRLSWGAAAPNGSPVTGYGVSVTTPDGTRTASVGPASRSTSLQWTCDRTADPSCSVGGNFSADVTATNAVGPGAAGSTSGSGGTPPPPPPPALPGGGRQHVSSSSTRFESIPVEGFARSTLSIAPPSDWAGFAGTCSYSYSGGYGNRAQSGQIACRATSLEIRHSTGYIRTRDGNQVDVNNQLTFTAGNGAGTVQSSTYQWTYSQDTLGDGEQPP